MLDVEDPETGITKRQSIAQHLIELATSYTVHHAGRDLELASGRDSVEAAKILFAYCYGKPPPSAEEQCLNLAEHFREVARDSVDLALKVLGERIHGMRPEEVADGLRAFSVNPRGFLDAAEEFVRKTDGGNPDVARLSSVDQDHQHSETGADQSSPKGCDKASHDPATVTWSDDPGGAAPSGGDLR
jgi:hypothetical protein